MAGTDITRLLEAIQKKIDAVDSSASSGDLLRLLSSVRQAGTGSLLSYTSASQFPNLIDGTSDPEMIGYNIEDGKLYFNRMLGIIKRHRRFKVVTMVIRLAA